MIVKYILFFNFNKNPWFEEYYEKEDANYVIETMFEKFKQIIPEIKNILQVLELKKYN